MHSSKIRASLALAMCGVAFGAVLQAAAQEAAPATPSAGSTPLDQEFRDPPPSARPRVWWHWMNGNVTKDGVAKDLAWLKAMGIGGVQNFDASLGTPQVVEKRLVYMHPEWKDAFRFAVSEADRHGLEFAIAASPGWSVTGGPWVAPQDGMKKLVWAETVLKGGKRFRGTVLAPSAVTGPFQDLPFFEPMPGHGEPGSKPTAGGRVAVLAVPIRHAALPTPRYRLPDGSEVQYAALADSSPATEATIALAADLSAAVTITYPRPVTVRSVRAWLPGLKLPFRGVPLKASLEVFEKQGWRHLQDLPITGVPTTQSLPETTGTQFRLRLEDSKDRGNLDLLNGAPGAIADNFFDTGPLKSVRIGDLQLFGEARTGLSEIKAGYETVPDYHAIASSDESSAGASTADVIDLTHRLQADGTLDWTPPRGTDWRVLHFGWSLTGKTNHPATPEATGLEVDKYDGAAVRRYLETYLANYRAAVGDDLIGKRGLGALLTDSIEVGNANWTPALEREFASRRGYALRPWLPALAGIPLGSPAQTDRFLFDFRQTLAELLAEKHYGTVAQVAHEQGLKVYGEALEDKRPMLGDDLAMRRHADVPMAAMWTWSKGGALRTTLLGDMKGAASVAHVYGKPYVAAESMTSVNSPWDFAPRDLKPVIDTEFLHGINRPVIHTSVHQPLDDMQPGLSLAIFGQYFNRHEAWAPLARPWVDYIARTSYLLQQGRNVADVAWFIGEDSPVTALFADRPPPGLPSEHAYDFVNAAMLSEALRTEGNQVVASGGARYQAIYLGGTSQRMTLPTLKRLATLVEAGATLIGPQPEQSPSQADDPAEFARLANALWSGESGRGKVIATADIDAGLAQAGIAPGMRIAGAKPGTALRYVQRAIAGGQLFFIANPGAGTTSVEARFRVTGKQPELWDAQTGSKRPLGYRIEGQETLVRLTLQPDDAVFVVFSEDTSELAREISEPRRVAAGTIGTPWTLAFQAGRGAPAQLVLDRLAPLQDHGDPQVRYFSGVVTYANTFAAPKGWSAGQPLWLDLGEVAEVAEVWVNDQRIGGLWRSPWRIDVGPALRKGSNRLEVRVANKWVNRLIGDAQPGARPMAKLAAPGYRADAALRPSGLIGPVTLWTQAR